MENSIRIEVSEEQTKDLAFKIAEGDWSVSLNYKRALTDFGTSKDLSLRVVGLDEDSSTEWVYTFGNLHCPRSDPEIWNIVKATYGKGVIPLRALKEGLRCPKVLGDLAERLKTIHIQGMELHYEGLFSEELEEELRPPQKVELPEESDRYATPFALFGVTTLQEDERIYNMIEETEGNYAEEHNGARRRIIESMTNSDTFFLRAHRFSGVGVDKCSYYTQFYQDFTSEIQRFLEGNTLEIFGLGYLRIHGGEIYVSELGDCDCRSATGSLPEKELFCDFIKRQGLDYEVAEWIEEE